MKIKMKPGHNVLSYSPTVDTEACHVEIREAFIGPKFVSPDGEVLWVQMRDGGYELLYETEGKRTLISLVGGMIK